MAGLLTALSAAAPSDLQAQRPAAGGMRQRPPEAMAKAQTARLKEDLSLTTEQEKAVYDVNLRFATRMTAARKEAEAAGGKPDMDSLRSWSRQRDAGLKAILQADQYEKMIRQREQMRQQRGPGGGRRGGGLRRQ